MHVSSFLLSLICWVGLSQIRVDAGEGVARWSSDTELSVNSAAYTKRANKYSREIYTSLKIPLYCPNRFHRPPAYSSAPPLIFSCTNRNYSSYPYRPFSKAVFYSLCIFPSFTRNVLLIDHKTGANAARVTAHCAMVPASAKWQVHHMCVSAISPRFQLHHQLI